MRRRAVLLLAVMTAALIMVASPAWATTFTVNSTSDPGTGSCDLTECTLREAIIAANSNLDTTTALAGVATYFLRDTEPGR